MRPQAIDSRVQWPDELTPPRGIMVLAGYGLNVRVWRGRLRVEDGVGRQRRAAILHRATSGLRRLVVIGHTGAISFEAIRWLADVGAGYLQIDEDCRLLAAFGRRGTDRPGLRRAQALALDSPLGNDITRRLLTEKVAGQARVLGQLGAAHLATDGSREAIGSAAARLRVAAVRDDLRFAEAQAAMAYWNAWGTVPVRFARRDVDRTPMHWRYVGSRSSPLASGPRLAVNPANAILNYLYAILEGEATIAAWTVGLDPGMGVLHDVRSNRDSLATDLMEPIRPSVDEYVLRLLAERVFALADFFETRQGVCRLTPRLARELALTAPEWGAAVGRVAEDVAARLGGSEVPTPITSRRRRVAQGGSATPGASTHPRVLRACTICGGRVPTGRATCSSGCEQEASTIRLDRFIAAGRANLEATRAAWHGTMSPEVRQQVGRRTSELVRAARAWQRTHPWPELARFAVEIRPLLGGVSPGEMSRATGLSVAYCRRIKGGSALPHPMWWDGLREIGNARPA